MKKLPIALLSLILLAASSGLSETELIKMPGAEVEVYKKASGDDLRIYRFDPPGHNPETDSRPAIVFFFGGGWNGGAVTQFEPHSRYLASRGMVAFVADYRVKSRQDTAPNACVADGKSAIRWVRKNAERLGIDPDQIAAGGGSAGGHVAAATGMCEGFDEESEDTSISSKPNLLALFNPVYDNGPKGYGHSRVTEWFPAISPAHNITKDDPPTIVFLGSKDKLIPVETSESFDKKLKENGIDSELYIYDDRTHGFFNRGKGDGKDFIDTVLRTDAFLQKHGYLEGEPDKALLDRLSEGKKS